MTKAQRTIAKQLAKDIYERMEARRLAREAETGIEDDQEYLRAAWQAFPQTVQSGPALEDEIVTVFGLSEEQTVLHTRFPALAGGKEGDQSREPFLGATEEVWWF